LIECEDPDSAFSQILVAGEGLRVKVTESNQEILRRFCTELRNSELFGSIFHAFEGELNIENVISRLSFLFDAEFDCEMEQEFASVHFWQLLNHESSSELSSLKADCIEQLISRQSLTLMNEESLWHFLRQSSLIDKCPSLLRFVRYDYLSIESVIEFADIVSSSFDFMIPAVWAAIRARLILPVLPPPLETRFCDLFHPFCEDRPLSGIITYLTRKHSGNVHDRGIVTLTASSQTEAAANRPIRNLADLNTACNFWTRNESNQWICWNFKGLRIIPSHYTIMSEHGYVDLRSWVLEGSKDGSSWMELDKRENDASLKGGKIATFKIGRQEEVVMIRIRQTDTNHRGDHHLSLGAVEFFGSLKGASV
jgi:hypothetical protein